MEFNSIIEKRHSVRSFRSKKASWKLVLEAIDAANQGPFADNINPLKFLIIEEQSTIDKIAELSGQLWINESNMLVIVCSDDTHLEHLHSQRGKRYARQQSGAAINTFILKLTDLGLSSCWVGSFTDDRIKQNLKIPGHIELEAIIPVGYEKTKNVKRRKRPLENTLNWEYWGSTKRPSLFNEDAPDPGSIES
jgi:nitroreductase